MLKRRYYNYLNQIHILIPMLTSFDRRMDVDNEIADAAGLSAKARPCQPVVTSNYQDRSYQNTSIQVNRTNSKLNASWCRTVALVQKLVKALTTMHEVSMDM